MLALGLTAYAIAKAWNVPHPRIERIGREEMGITSDTSLRLGRYVGMDPQIWVDLQTDHDILTARAAMGDEVERITPLDREAA